MKEKKTEKKKSKIATEGDFADPPARPKKRSEDGLALYTGGVGNRRTSTPISSTTPVPLFLHFLLKDTMELFRLAP
ncbi:hypothetical protein LWI29_000419 [Acer saccharum]|uniref:Uncharacterized protein n=1 Tax=Acer saccharum TaxID=4024 RepID=A0AA39RA38_ACESA|nr:hypothetical protein LWI29_000419 [Acer saccharum]